MLLIAALSPQTPKGALNSAIQSPFRGLGQKDNYLYIKILTHATYCR
jgi:hypothetical protein